MTSIAIIIVCIAAFFVGIVLGAWFMDFTKASDLKRQNAQLKAEVDMLQELVNYHEGRTNGKNN